MKTRIYAFLLAICVLLLASCSEPEAEMATITIRMGTNPRVAVDTITPTPFEPDSFSYELFINGSSYGTSSSIVHDPGSNASASGVFNVNVPINTPLKIVLKAYGPEPTSVSPGTYSGFPGALAGNMLRAIGIPDTSDADGNITITASGAINITMITAFEITNSNDLVTAFTFADPAKEEIFIIKNDIQIVGGVGLSGTLTVSIISEGNVSLTRDPGTTGTLILLSFPTAVLNLGRPGFHTGTLTIDGSLVGSAIGPLIGIGGGGGALNMYDGVILTGNNYTDPNSATGGAVHLGGSSATFNMYGGEIKDNEVNATSSTGAALGGGVCVESGANFTMGSTYPYLAFSGKRGRPTISGNNASSTSGKAYGGGVYVDSATLFKIEGNASITANTTSASGAGASVGGGVYVYDSDFTMEGGVIGGETGQANEALSGGSGGGVFFGGNGSPIYTFFMKNDAKIKGNIADSGGGVFVEKGNLSMEGFAKIIGNTANVATWGAGGGVFINHPSSSDWILMKNDAEISDNTATGSTAMGGGVFFRSSGTFDMQDNSKLTGNRLTTNSTATDGAGVYNVSGSGTMTWQVSPSSPPWSSQYVYGNLAVSAPSNYGP